MTFKRYEIRTYYHRCFYEGGDTFDYVPFDTLQEVYAYVKDHTYILDNENTFLCKVILHSNYDEVEEKTQIKYFYDFFSIKGHFNLSKYYKKKLQFLELASYISTTNGGKEYLAKIGKRYGLLTFLRKENLL